MLGRLSLGLIYGAVGCESLSVNLQHTLNEVLLNKMHINQVMYSLIYDNVAAVISLFYLV